MVEPENKPPAGKPRSRALAAGIGLALIGVGAFLYVLFSGVSKPPPVGLDRFAAGGLSKLQVAPKPPPQPPLPITDAAGRETSLAAFRGKVVLVNLWATWCAPCVAEMPTLAKLQQVVPGGDFAVVAISIDQARQKEAARAMLAKLTDKTLPFFHDPGAGAFAFAVQIPGQASGVPTTILYDRKGRELARLAGGADWAGPEAQALVREALQE